MSATLRFLNKVLGCSLRYALCPLPFLGWVTPVFAFLSAVYISVIFLFAGSPSLSRIGMLNPFSLLHIPLYLILTLLIVLSIVPFPFFRLFRSNAVLPHLPINTSTHQRIYASTHLRIYASTHLRMNGLNPINQTVRFLVAGLISLAVAVLDEYHQSFIPLREASITDVLLDVMGIVLALWLIRRFYKWQSTFNER